MSANQLRELQDQHLWVPSRQQKTISHIASIHMVDEWSSGSARREEETGDRRLDNAGSEKSIAKAQASSLKPPTSVHRLLDITVEVSLVDRAANKHRFLIVKRRTEMSDRAQNDTHDEATSTPDPIDDEVSWAEDETETSEVTGAEDSPTLETAVSALQGLLEAVTLLGGTNADNERQGGQGR